MVRGLARETALSDLVRNPESWPDSTVEDIAARAVQATARALAFALEREK